MEKFEDTEGGTRRVDNTMAKRNIKKSLEIPKGISEFVNRRTDNTMSKRKSTKEQTTTYKTYT
jgi:hypothetical protein